LLDVTEISRPDRRVRPMEKKSPKEAVVYNYNEGGWVGIQAASVTGSSVVLGAEQPSVTVGDDLPQRLTDLRKRVQKEHSAGALDDATYKAASQEIDNAEKVLPAETEEDRSSLVIALRKLSGLVTEVAGITSSVSGIISAVSQIP
jgi:adenosylhomocysteine nucleosidase